MWSLVIIGFLGVSILFLIHKLLTMPREDIGVRFDQAFIVDSDLQRKDKEKIDRWMLDHEIKN